MGIGRSVHAQDRFEEDLLSLKDRLMDNKTAQNMYAALCNIEWQNIEETQLIYGCSWRYAGGLIAGIRDQGEDYMEYYCSGIGNNNTSESVPEQTVTDEIREMLLPLGWIPKEYEDSFIIIKHDDIYYLIYSANDKLEIRKREMKTLETIKGTNNFLIHLQEKLPEDKYMEVEKYLLETM